jgi:hypothetical protein
MVRHTTSAGASISTSRSITRPDISIRSSVGWRSSALAVNAGLLPASATNGSTSRDDLQPMVAYGREAALSLLHRRGTRRGRNGVEATLIETGD